MLIEFSCNRCILFQYCITAGSLVKVIFSTLPPLGRHNLMIVIMDTFNSTIQMTSRKLEKISQTLYSFSDLCSHSINPQYLNDISVHGGLVRIQYLNHSENIDRIQKYPFKFEEKPSSKSLIFDLLIFWRKLFEFFAPFNRHLSQIIGIDLDHWNSMV